MVVLFCESKRQHVVMIVCHVDMGSGVQMSYIVTYISVVFLALRPEFSSQGDVTAGTVLHLKSRLAKCA